MRDSRRRNRNIGTEKQGHGQDNRLTIPESYTHRDVRFFTERLTEGYSKVMRRINGHEFVFIIEKTSPGFLHACSVDDVAYMLGYIPLSDYGALKYIVFRQPTQKEKILSSVWGRLSYSYWFEEKFFPAVILEAFKEGDELVWSRKLSVQDTLEFERLKQDGHVFAEDKRSYKSQLTQEAVRSTQLYRTLLHEIGHYVHYQNVLHEEGEDFYFESVLKEEKEKFAHAYADKMASKLRAAHIIPFPSSHE